VPLDKKTIKLVEDKMSESIGKLRAASEKEVKKLMRRAEETSSKEKKCIYFNRAMDIARKTEQTVAQLETQMASLVNPWHATPPDKKKRKS
jgi:uncharacterized protein YoxC